mgnify:FL=1
MAALLEVQHISKHFGGLKATDDISMQVEQGEILGIIGPNGAGKTTFFNLITGTYRLTSGKILFDGKDVTNYTPEKMAKLGMARTFQNIKLFKFLSVLENVKVGFHIQTSTGMVDSILHTKRYRNDEALANEKGMEILRRVGLANQAALLAGNLPYGWQRRLEIARAMALSPKILLLDEPAAGMNPSETAELMGFIRTLRDDGITVVVIEHDMKFMMNLCDRIVVINYGKKLAEGTPAEVTRNEQVIEAYLGTGLTIDSKRAGGHANE